MKKLAISISLLFFAFMAFGQLTQKEIRRINTSAIELISETYPRYCDYSSRSNMDKLLLIFTNDAIHFNDILPMNKQGEFLNLKDYVSQLTDLYDKGKLRIQVNVKGLSYIKQEGTGYTLYCDMEKIIRGNTKEGYSILDTLECKATLYCTVELDEDGRSNTEVKISKVEIAEKESYYYVVTPYFKLKKDGKSLIKDSFFIAKGGEIINSGQTDPNGYFIHKSNDKTDLGKLYSTNSSLIGKKKLKFSDDENESNLVYAKFRKHPISVGLTAVNGFNGVSQINSESILSLSQKVESYNGLKLNFNIKVFGNNDKVNVNLRAGAEYGILNRLIYFDNFNKRYSATDPDGASYVRTVSLSNFSENQDVNVLMPSVGLGLSCRILSQRINFHVDYSRILARNFTTSLSTDLTFSGYYEDLYGLTIQENGIYDFGSYQVDANAQSFNPNENADMIAYGIELEKPLTSIVKNSVFARRISLSIGFESRSSINSFTLKGNDGFNIYSNENITTASQLFEKDQLSFNCVMLGINYKI